MCMCVCVSEVYYPGFTEKDLQEKKHVFLKIVFSETHVVNFYQFVSINYWQSY